MFGTPLAPRTCTVHDERRLQFGLRIYTLYTAGQFEALESLLALNFRISESAEAPWGGNYAGHQGTWSFWRNLHQHFKLSVQLDRAVESGSNVLAVGILTGLSKVTIEFVSVPFVHIWSVQGSVVRSLDSYLDRSALAQAFP